MQAERPCAGEREQEPGANHQQDAGASKGAEPDEYESDEGQYAERNYGDLTHEVPQALRLWSLARRPVVHSSEEAELPGS